MSSFITSIGITIILTYSIVKLLEFYGIGISNYGPYLSFYVFILVTSYILPRYYNNITKR
jgi:hypothetical protein